MGRRRAFERAEQDEGLPLAHHIHLYNSRMIYSRTAARSLSQSARAARSQAARRHLSTAPVSPRFEFVVAVHLELTCYHSANSLLLSQPTLLTWSLDSLEEDLYSESCACPAFPLALAFNGSRLTSSQH